MSARKRVQGIEQIQRSMSRWRRHMPLVVGEKADRAEEGQCHDGVNGTDRHSM